MNFREWLQQEENKKNGKKAQEVSFVFASRELNKFIKKKNTGGIVGTKKKMKKPRGVGAALRGFGKACS